MTDQELLQEYIETLTDTSKYKKFGLFIDTANARCQTERDMVIVVNGPRGEGKSTFGEELVRIYLKRFFGLNMTKALLNDCVPRDADDFENKVDNLPIGRPIWMDEGVISAYVGDHATKSVKDLVKRIAVCRTKRRPIIIICPDFSDVIKRLTKYAVYRVRIIERGIGVLFAKDESEGATLDPFHLKEMEKLEGYHDSGSNKIDILKKLKKHTCFKDILVYPAMPKQVQLWYDELREDLTSGKNGKDYSRQNERLAMVYHNLSSKWEELKKLSRLTQTDFINKVCVNPVSENSFWKSSSFLSEQLKILSMQLQEKESKKAQQLPEENKT